MKSRLLKTATTLLLALCVSAGAAAQSRTSHSAWLPVWNKASGKLEAYLVLEPAKDAQVPGRWRFGNNSLDATYGLGRFWTKYRPAQLIGVDINPEKSDGLWGPMDFRNLNLQDQAFDVVVFDPAKAGSSSRLR